MFSQLFENVVVYIEKTILLIFITYLLIIGEHEI